MREIRGGGIVDSLWNTSIDPIKTKKRHPKQMTAGGGFAKLQSKVKIGLYFRRIVVIKCMPF